jgi:hypothetical protein
MKICLIQRLRKTTIFVFNYIEYKNGDKDSPCINPALQEKNSENSPFSLTHVFSFEYIDFKKL